MGVLGEGLWWYELRRHHVWYNKIFWSRLIKIVLASSVCISFHWRDLLCISHRKGLVVLNESLFHPPALPGYAKVRRSQRNSGNLSSTSARSWGLQGDVRQSSDYSVVCSQLLLSVWERSGYLRFSLPRGVWTETVCCGPGRRASQTPVAHYTVLSMTSFAYLCVFSCSPTGGRY